MRLQKRLSISTQIALALPAIIVLFYYLQPLVDYMTYELFTLKADSHWGQVINFFFYDSIKIIILVFLISSLMGLVNTYFPVERLRNYLTTKKLYGLQYLFASLFGAVTPFCSCSSIPLFIGFVQGGIPLGVTFAYLITSPLVNEVAVAMFLGFFGWKTTLIYATSGIFLGVIGGFLLGKLKLDRYLADWVQQIQRNADPANIADFELENQSFTERLPAIIADGWGIVRKVLPYIILGIGIGALMHGFVPENFFSEYLSEDKWYAIPLAVIMAVPLYASASGIVPIIQVFVAKGVPLGTAIAFMMAVIGLSLPEATLLKKVMQWKLIGIFFATITLFIILLGYLFNWIL
ncbi:permease [Carboxylicivirga sediminis]|uniref:Permease n=1 Tax=Carboxylicivirga sediminis TaxID=2006564 RepID=A0A941F3K8_9BACT|nr:permease [Carboxylicivirga sediminis]MBR8535309.1 permease [Carboxylicivirga sediminis]